MSSIIQTVSFKSADAKDLKEKLSEHLGIHKLKFTIKGGETLEGILTEIGKDYISLIYDDYDFVIPLDQIIYFKYSN